MDRRQEMLRLFAGLMDYPRAETPELAGRCCALLNEAGSPAALELAPFIAWMKLVTLEEMEEAYTGAFDVNPPCHPYVGHQIFGESNKRSAFIVRLKQRYREHGFDAGKELPDHLGAALRFAALLDEEEARSFAEECVAPAVNKMTAGFDSEEGKGNPYAHLLRALLQYLAPHGVRSIPDEREPSTCSFVSPCFVNRGGDDVIE